MKYRFDAENHIHLLDNKPLTGTSSVVSVLSKNLTWWAAELAAITCLESGEKIPTIREEYLAAVLSTEKKKAINELQKKYPIFKKARFAHYEDKNKKAEKGIDLHSCLEIYINYIMNGNSFECDCCGWDDDRHTHEPFCNSLVKFDARIMPFIEWSKKNVKKWLWSEAHCYDESPDMWVGGIIDFGAELLDSSIILGDFKSSDKPYLSHWLQSAGYVIQAEHNGLFDSEGNQIYKLDKPIDKIVIVPFGAEAVIPAFNEIPLGDLKIAFKNAVNLYRIKTKWEE